MSERRTWVIIDLKTNRTIYGYDNITMRFSTQEIAHEVAECLFKKRDEYLLTQIIDK